MFRGPGATPNVLSLLTPVLPVTKVDGQPVPYELAYSRWLTGWVMKLLPETPSPSEELMIVARWG